MKTLLLFVLIGFFGCSTVPAPSPLSLRVCDDLNLGNDFKYPDYYGNDFRQAIPQEQMAAIIGQVKATHGTCQEVIDYKEGANGATFSTKHSSEKVLDFSITERDGVIVGLRLLGERAKQVEYANWNAVGEDFKQYSDGRLLLIKNQKETILSQAPNKRTPLGSVFKLFILDALSTAKDFSWDSELAIKDHWKSLPSGTMQNEKAGTAHELRHYAKQMISISDNTATDHLLLTLGRASVEKQIKERKLKQSYAWNRPFLSTRELFLARAIFTPKQYQLYANATNTGRLRMLQSLPKMNNEELLTKISDWSEARGIYAMEWYSTPSEVCTLLTAMHNENNPEVIKILSLNTPFVDRDSFEVALYKGGSEPGVVQMAYFLKGKKSSYCLYAGISNASGTVDEGAFFQKVKGLINLIAKEDG